MLFSYNLLSELVDLNGISPEELVNKLTFASFEVEGYHKLAQADKLVIGHVEYCQKHPDSDHLHVLRVNCGTAIGTLDIVCGAPNVAEGENVIIARVGCSLPVVNETIQASKIRGFDSFGMCCSLSELGVSKSGQSDEDLKGIHVLPADAPVGEENVLSYLGLDDTIIDVSILPNRPDCLSHLGFAREISAIFNRRLLKSIDGKPDFSIKSSYEASSATSFCQEFLLAEITGVDNTGKTPEKARKYLNSLGLRSVSPIVDLGNYAMLLTGQPLHMYDLDKVKGKKLTARDDFEGDVVALDGKTYHVIKGDIVISDEEKPCCLAGVMGLMDVCADSDSTHIGIEAANFYYANIRHTSSRLGLVSDSSSLFSKGVNPYLCPDALHFTLGLLKDFFPQAVIRGLAKYDEVPAFDGSFAFSLERLNKRMGASYPPEDVLDIVKRLGLSFDGKSIKKDSHRLDICEQCDMDEEIFRLLDQKSISLSLDGLPVTHGVLTSEQVKTSKIRSLLVSNGLNEIVTYTLVSQKMASFGQVFANRTPFKVLHPLTEDHEYVRTGLLSSLCQSLDYNRDHKNNDGGLFEISSIDTKEGNYLSLSIGLMGLVSSRGLIMTHKADFYDMKGYFEAVMEALGLDSNRYTVKRSVNSFFHPGKSADVFIGRQLVASFGEVSPLVSSSGYIVLEADLSFLMEQKCGKLKVVDLPVLQPVRKDLAFHLLDRSVASADLEKAIRKAGGKYLKDAVPFDVFEKDGEVYYAFALTLYREDKSFTDSEINSLLNTIILNVTHTLKVEIRK